MVTQAFPKLIYALDENNMELGSEYYDLTKLAAYSTAKRMNPDYVSVKVMELADSILSVDYIFILLNRIGGASTIRISLIVYGFHSHIYQT